MSARPHEEALLESFLDPGDGSAPGRNLQRRELVERLQPLIAWHVSRHFPTLRRHHDDLEGRCFARLVEWRSLGRLSTEESLWHLARRLVRHEGEMEVERLEGEAYRAAEVQRIPKPQTPDPEEAASRSELLDRVRALFAQLPENHARVLEAHVAANLHDGPPLEVELDCDKVVARKRLERARVALAALALEHRLVEGLQEYGVDLSGESR